MQRLHRAVAGALLLAAGCASPAAPHHRSAPRPAPVTVPVVAPPELDAALDQVVASPTGRFHYEVVLEPGADPDGEEVGSIVVAVEGAFDRPAGRWAVGPGQWQGPPPDPSALAEVLRSAEPLEPDGDEAISGAPTKRYRTMVHLDDVLDRVADDRVELVGAELDALADTLDELGVPSADDAVEARVWLGADGTLRRFELELPVAEDAFGPGASARIVLELYDYGSNIVFVG